MYFKKVLPLFVLIFGFSNFASSQSVVCPAVRTTSGWLDLFPLPCRKHAECRVMGTQHLCCKAYCTKGVKSAQTRTDQQSSVASTSTTSTSTSTSTSTTTSTTTTTTSTTTASPPSSSTQRSTEAPAPRPFLQLLPIQTTNAPTQRNAPPPRNAIATTQKNAPSKTGKSQKFICPRAGTAPVLLFPIPCESSSQCRASSGPDQVCCERRCVKGVPAPRPTSPPESHQPILGVIPRECPSTPLGELLFEVQSCKSDSDCWPRLCCPDGSRSYCRTARARLDLVPIANQIDGPVRLFEQYLQCTAPPQVDLFPQRCQSSVDCFPNLCCAEGGKKHCRPPQRSLIALLAGVTQRVGNTIGNLRQGQAATRNKA